MFSILRFKNSKKGILALETILSLILSVIILFFIFQVFYNAFLQTPTNLKIAEDNAKSIVEFIDYSNNKYSNNEKCYTMLKLKNLENYQYKDPDGKNYFLVIDSKGIGIYKKEIFDLFLKDATILDNNIPEKHYSFKINKNIKNEKIQVSQKLFDFSIQVFDYLNNFGILDFYTVYLKNLENFYYEPILSSSNKIIIYPVFGKFIFGIDTSSFTFHKIGPLEIDPSANNQNILYALNYEKLNNYDMIATITNAITNQVYHDSYYLVYQPSSNIFPTYTMDTENYVKKNLCEYENFLKKEQKKFFKDRIDYFNKINKNIGFKTLNQNGDIYKFIFRDNKKKCFENSNLISCKNIFGINIDKLNYNDFISKINGLSLNYRYGNNLNKDGVKIYEDKTESEFTSDLLIPTTLTIEELDNTDNFFKYTLKRTFFDSVLNLVGMGKNMVNNGIHLNNCNLAISLCDAFFVSKKSKKVYFYDNRYYNNFVTFNIKYLEKKQLSGTSYQIYFNKKSVITKSQELSGDGNTQAGQIFYFINLPTKNGNTFQFILSDYVLKKIAPLNYNRRVNSNGK